MNVADQRTCYAGDLGSDAIGRDIRFTLGNGEKITGEVTEIDHRPDPDGKRTVIRLAEVDQVRRAFTLPEAFTVELLPLEPASTKVEAPALLNHAAISALNSARMAEATRKRHAAEPWPAQAKRDAIRRDGYVARAREAGASEAQIQLAVYGEEATS